MSQKNDEESLMINETEYKGNGAYIVNGAINQNVSWIAGHPAHSTQLIGEDIKIELEAKSQSSDKEEPS